jgi:hypothetical protein
MRSVGDQHVDEVMITNTRTKENKYYKAGDYFDGGKLIFVHQLGALVRRIDGYFVYPLGNLLEAPLPIESADEYPELKAAAEKHKGLVEADREAKRAAAAKPAMTPEAISLDDPTAPAVEAELKGEGGPEKALAAPSTDGKSAVRPNRGRQPDNKGGQGPALMPPVPHGAAKPETAKPEVPKPSGPDEPSAAPEQPATTDSPPSDDVPKSESPKPEAAPVDGPKPNEAPTDGAQAKPAGPDKDGNFPNPGRPLRPRARPWKGQNPQPAGKP